MPNNMGNRKSTVLVITNPGIVICFSYRRPPRQVHKYMQCKGRARKARSTFALLMVDKAGYPQWAPRTGDQDPDRRASLSGELVSRVVVCIITVTTCRFPNGHQEV